MDYLWPYCNNFVKLEFPAIVMEGEESAAEEQRISPCSKQYKRTTTVKRANQLWHVPALDTDSSRLF